MVVTDVKVTKYEKNSLKAFATITIDKAFVVSGLTIIEGSKGLFVTMPQNKGKDGKYHDSVFPLTKELRTEISKSVLDAYSQGETLPFN